MTGALRAPQSVSCQLGPNSYCHTMTPFFLNTFSWLQGLPGVYTRAYQRLLQLSPLHITNSFTKKQFSGGTLCSLRACLVESPASFLSMSTGSCALPSNPVREPVTFESLTIDSFLVVKLLEGCDFIIHLYIPSTYQRSEYITGTSLTHTTHTHTHTHTDKTL